MKIQSVRPLYRRLTILLTLALVWGSLVLPAQAGDEWTGCSEPFRSSRTECWWWFWCYDVEQGCAVCDQGTACFDLVE